MSVSTATSIPSLVALLLPALVYGAVAPAPAPGYGRGRPWKSCAAKFDLCYSSSWRTPHKSMPCCNRYDSCIVKDYNEAVCIPKGMIGRIPEESPWDLTELDLEEMPETVLGGPMCEAARNCTWCELCSGKDACLVSTFDGQKIPESAVSEEVDGFYRIDGFYDSDYVEGDVEGEEGKDPYNYIPMEACVDQCRSSEDCNMIHWWNQYDCEGGGCYGRCNHYSATKKWCPGMACPTVSNEGSVDHTFIKKSACKAVDPEAQTPMPGEDPTEGSYK